jgi:hypothetical protein
MSISAFGRLKINAAVQIATLVVIYVIGVIQLGGRIYLNLESCMVPRIAFGCICQMAWTSACLASRNGIEWTHASFLCFYVSTHNVGLQVSNGLLSESGRASPGLPVHGHQCSSAMGINVEV